MRQQTFAEGTFEVHAKPTRRAAFLADMERVVPWSELCAVIAPFYPKGEGGRPTVGLERMLRIYFLQQWFNLSDPAVEEAIYDSAAMRRFVGVDLGRVEEAIYDSAAMRRFVGVDLGREAAPDETTILRFRHLLEQHHLGRKLFEQVHRHLEAQGMKVARGTIVDATIISAPPSTKNRDKQRDPDMHQTRKGNQWHFGMKAHIGVDSKSKIIHAVVATAANVADSHILPDLLHGDETKVWGDRAYQGQTDVIRQCAPKAQDMTHRRCRRKGEVDEIERAKNRNKSRVRAKVEHAFGVIKNIFGFVKVRYKGLMKNANRLFATCALTNLYLARRHLLRSQGARYVQ